MIEEEGRTRGVGPASLRKVRHFARLTRYCKRVA